MKNRARFDAAAQLALAGLKKHGVALAVAHCTVPELTALIAAQESAHGALGRARAQRRTAHRTARAARGAAKTRVGHARDYLSVVLGRRWNESWIMAGFGQRSLRLPRKDAALLATLHALENYFIVKPEQESAVLGLTAAKFEERHTAFQAALAAVMGCRYEQRTAREAREVAERALEKKLRCLRAELKSVLAPEDARWMDFAERIPADLRVPGAVAEFRVASAAAGRLWLEWKRAVRAARYKVYRQITGGDEPPVLVCSVMSARARLTGLPPGGRVRLYVVAANATGDGVASEVLEVAVLPRLAVA